MSDTYATVVTSGKQYRVKSGDVITVNRMTAEVGSEIVLDNVLLLEKQDGSVQIAADTPVKAAVTATVREHLRGDKLRVFKMRRRKKSRRTQGHRQDLTQLLIGDIKADH